MMRMNKRCMHYMGDACINGTCQITSYDSCKFCFFYKGCEDCYFKDTLYCDDYQEGLKQDGEGKL